MKLLLDQGRARSTVGILARRGIHAQHVGHLGMAKSTDEAIIEFARNKQWTIVTLDGDFHALLAQSKQAGPSAIRIRIEGLKAEPMADVICKVIEQSAEDIHAGAMVTIDEGSMRIRRLPMGMGGHKKPA